MNYVERAQQLCPLLRESAREAEIARRPLDAVIESIRDSGLFSLMVPKQYGGAEQDLDTFFDVVLTLSKADASMGWLTGFYIEHNLWLFNYPQHVYERVLGDANYVLAPATLNIGAGSAGKVDGGYRLSGQWQWGTGIVHGTWVMAGGLAENVAGDRVPMIFLLPVADVEPIDTWYVTGMCATGSMDFRIDDVFVADDYALPFQQFLDASSGITERLAGPLYSTPLMPVLGFAASLPILGAAHGVVEAFARQSQEKVASKATRFGAPLPDVSAVLGEAALKVDAAELVMRDVLADVIAKRKRASETERSLWLARLAYAVFTCKETVLRVSEETGASGGLLSNPLQRAVRDISIAANHVVFAKAARYGDVGRMRLGQHGGSPPA